MDQLFPVDIASRWIHVGTAIVIVGGSIFMRFVVMPAAAELPEAEHDSLRQRILGRWKKFVLVGIILFLVSGFYNYLKVSVPAHKGDGLYHGLMGLKMIMAFVIFFLASALVGRSAKLEGLRRNAKKTLGIMITLAAIIVAISGFLKIRGAKEKTQPAETTSWVNVEPTQEIA